MTDKETHPLVHNQLGSDQKWQRHQVTDVDFYIEQEWYDRTPTESVLFQNRENQERQPSDERNGDDTAPRQHHRVIGQMRTTQKLEQWPAQDEREIRRVLKEWPARLWTLAEEVAPAVSPWVLS